MRRVSPLALAAAFSFGATAAMASPATLTGNYSVSEQYTYGGPGITYDLGSWSGSNRVFSQGLTAGVQTSAQNFFTASPAGSCYGSGCSSNIQSDQLTINFSNLAVSGYGSIANFSITAAFTAKYSGSVLSCAQGDGRSNPGATDCVVWTGAANTYNGSTMVTKALANGYSLDIFLYNATDWNITPTIGFELVDPPSTSVPEPASLGLTGAALAALGLIRRRRRG